MLLLSRVRESLRWRLWKARRVRFLRTHFRNGDELARAYLSKAPCPAAVLTDGTVLRHPPHRVGLAGTLLEVWYDEAYTGAFYTPQPGDTVIDGGANVGAFSLLLARTEPRCRVVAFEPFAENYALLTANLGAALGTTVRAIRAGLSGASAVGVMTDGGARSLDHRLTVGRADDPAAVRTFDFADALGLTEADEVALFKCDIEGSEYDLFASADAAHLRRVRRFAIEYHDQKRAGTRDLIAGKLSGTHAVTVRPDPEGGYGMIYAVRR